MALDEARLEFQATLNHWNTYDATADDVVALRQERVQAAWDRLFALHEARRRADPADNELYAIAVNVQEHYCYVLGYLAEHTPWRRALANAPADVKREALRDAEAQLGARIPLIRRSLQKLQLQRRVERIGSRTDRPAILRRFAVGYFAETEALVLPQHREFEKIARALGVG